GDFGRVPTPGAADRRGHRALQQLVLVFWGGVHLGTSPPPPQARRSAPMIFENAGDRPVPARTGLGRARALHRWSARMKGSGSGGGRCSPASVLMRVPEGPV